MHIVKFAELLTQKNFEQKSNETTHICQTNRKEKEKTVEMEASPIAKDATK